MSISKIQFEKEIKYLNETLNIITELINNSNIYIDNKKKILTDYKKYIWEFRTQMTDAELIKEMDMADQNVDGVNDIIKKLNNLENSLSSPYFARIDFTSKDNEKNNIYIGMTGVQKDYKNYVFDWRAPISSLFYNYDKGPASYETPNGKINGDITLKRQFKIDDGVIVRCFDSSVNINDEILQEILSTSSSDKMKNIVTTIQQTQNKIIRNIKNKTLVVQGVAGSGKTSVALHRIAYLMYKFKDLKSNNVLIFSPNDVFSEYISNVLPELGEENVLTSTFEDFSKAYIKGFKKIENWTDFIEKYYKSNNTDFSLTKLKLSDTFKDKLDEYLKDYFSKVTFTKSISIKDKHFSQLELNLCLHHKTRHMKFNDRVDYIVDNLCSTSKISYKKNSKILRKNLISLLSKSIKPQEVYQNFLQDTFDIKDSLNTAKLNYEDLINLLYITFEIDGYPYISDIRHIVIDEAQDYSKMQFEILNSIFPKSSWTILGDINQCINPHYNYNSMKDICSIFNKDNKYVELNDSYRSSQEIIDFSNSILGADIAKSIRTSKNNFVKFRLEGENLKEQLINDIKLMKNKNLNHIAIITKTNTETNRIYDLLKPTIDVGLAKNGQINKEVTITPSYISKGLEFDGAIIYTDINNQYNNDEKTLFYVVCTRAQNDLIIYNQQQYIKK